MQASVSPSNLLIGLVFVSVFLLTFTIMRALLVRSEIKRRAQLRPIADLEPARNDETIAHEFLSFMGKLLPPSSAEGQSLARKEMIKAGFFSPNAVVIYHVARILLPLGLPLVLLTALSLLPAGLSAWSSLLGIVCISGLG